MPSKFDRLRSGEVVDIEPGRKGRLNLQNKSFETSDGRTMYVGDDPDFFPSDDRGLSHSREKETLQRDIKKSPFGEFGYQFGNQGVAGATKDWFNKLTKKGDDYLQSKRVNQEVSEEISERSPWTSGAATAASFVPDIALTKGMSAAKAAPLLTGLHAGSRILEEPGQVAGEAMFSALGGKLIDKGASAVNRIVQRRGQARALPGQQQAVREANATQTEQFNALKQNTKSVNEARLKKYQDDLNTRQNTIIQEQNAYEQAKLQRDTEVLRLKNKAEMEKAQRSATAAQSDADYRAAKEAADQENKRMLEKFKLDQTQYQRDLKNLPNIQKQAQEEYSSNVVKNAEGISNSFPKNSKINTSQLGVEEFVNESIQQGGLAGSRSAGQVNKILKTLFPEGEVFSAKELSTKYRDLEKAIQRSTPEVQKILNEFKTSMGNKLPNILADNMAYERAMPSFMKQLGKDVESVFKKLPKGSAFRSTKDIEKASRESIKNYFDKLSPTEFVEKIKNGSFKQEVMDHLFSDGGKNVLNAEGKVIATKNLPDYVRVLEDMMSTKLDSAIARAELKMIAVETDAMRRLGANVKRTYGTAEPVAPPNAPIAPQPMAAPVPPGELPPVAPPQLPPPVAPPQIPSIPGKPNLMADPMAPAAIPEPMLPPAQGMAERAGDFLEKPLLEGGGGQMNNLMKLGGLKYLLGKAALPAEAAYLGMKGLTSPTAAGQAVRASFKQGGIQAIDMWAQKYPSYHNGILENPQERRSLTKEVEDDSEIPIEQKAIIQSKINRGRPLQDRL